MKNMCTLGISHISHKYQFVVQFMRSSNGGDAVK